MNINYHNAEFLCSYFDTKSLPLEKKPEIVFVGRSNVGKSSMINKLLNRKNLAFTSSKPGKTAAINYFGIDKKIYLVDLPGYGFAQRSKNERKGWGSLIETYFSLDRDRRLVAFLMDSRHGATEDDLLMYDYLMAQTTPFCIVLTKADKLKKSEAEKIKAETSAKFGVAAILFSSENGQGVEELRSIIEDITD